MSKLTHHFDYTEEGHTEHLRIRGLAKDSGVRAAQKAGMRKWVLSHRTGRIWHEDAWVVLPNEATTSDAMRKFFGQHPNG